MNKLVSHEDPEEIVLKYLVDPKPELKQALIRAYSGLVEYIARRFSGVEPFEDLVQVGYIGLLNALSKYNKDSGVRFQTYAIHLVAGEIKHYLRDRSLLIRHPAWLQEVQHKIAKAKLAIQAETGEQPTEQEIAHHLGLSPDFIKEIQQTRETLKLTSLSNFAYNDEELPEIEQSSLIVPQEEAAVIEDRVLLEQAMSKLRDIEREALVSFYLGAMSQSDIAQKLGISCNYVSHVLRQALNKLRRFLAKEENPSVAEGRTSSVSLPIQPMQDPISGVYSEAYLHARLEEELHRASSACCHLGILLAYFKGLKQLKNYYGEESVEEFLSDAGTFLKGFASKLDVVCRYKASGFVLILPYMGARTRYLRNQLAEETLSWLRSRQAPTHFIQVEFGYALYPYDGNTAKELLEKAFSRLRSNLTKELASGDTSSRAA